MKKIILFTLAAVILTSGKVFATENKLMEIRDKILVESQDIKGLLVKTKDVILVSSMWDSCVLAISQLDSYFSQLGIFNTIKKDELTDTSIHFLSNWLKQMKKTNDLNIESLGAVNQKIEGVTKLHLERLKGYYIDLNVQIDEEFVMLGALKKAWVHK
jgi:hypothetical protein